MYTVIYGCTTEVELPVKAGALWVNVADGFPVAPVPALSVAPAVLLAVVPVAPAEPVGLDVDRASVPSPVVEVSRVPELCEPV